MNIETLQREIMSLKDAMIAQSHQIAILQKQVADMQKLATRELQTTAITQCVLTK